MNTKSGLIHVSKIVFAAVVVVWFTNGCRDHTQEVILEYLPETVDYAQLNAVATNRANLLLGNIDSGQNSLESFIELAQLFHANGLLREAISCYEGLLQVDPESAKWSHLLATLLAGYGYAEDATSLWLDVIEREPEYVPARIRLGDLYLKSNRLDEAEQTYRTVLEMDPKNPYAMVGLARLAMQSEDWPQAEKYLVRASAVSGGKIGKDLLVTVYEAEGKTYEAMVIRSEAKASGSFVDIVDPWMDEVNTHCYNPDMLVALGGYTVSRGDLKTSIELFKKALDIDPDHLMAHYQLSFIYEAFGMYELAIEHLNAAVDLKKDFADAWIKLTGLHEKKGDPGEALRIFYSGLMNCPKSPAYQIEYARRLKKEKKYTAAIAALKKSIEYRPNEALAYVELSSCYLALGREDEGVEALERALTVEAGDLPAMTSLCYYSILSEDKERAREMLTQLQKHPRFDKKSEDELLEAYRSKFGEFQ